MSEQTKQDMKGAARKALNHHDAYGDVELLDEDDDFTGGGQYNYMAPKKTKGDEILSDMQNRQRESFITDLFALMAAVLRARAGRILQRQEAGDSDWDDIIRNKDAQIFFFSFLGILSNVGIASLFWYNDQTKKVVGDTVERADLLLQDALPTRKAALYGLQLLLTSSTIVTCILIVQKYLLLVDEKKREWSGISTYTYVQAASGLKNNDEEAQEHRANAEKVMNQYESAYSFWRSHLRWYCFAEVGLQIVHPMIWMNTPDSNWRTLYESLEVLIFLRLYLAVKIVYSFSREYKQRNQILASNQDMQRNGFQLTVISTLKILFYKYPTLFSLSLLVVFLVNLGFIVFILERRHQPSVEVFGRLENAFWFTFVTFSTVGFGDMAPISPLGRIASIFIGAAGISITTIFGGVATNLMVQSREERYIAEYLNMVQAADDTKESAARTIQAAWRQNRLDTKSVLDPWQTKGHKSNFVYKNIKEFRSHRWKLSQSRSTANDPVIDSKMNRMSSKLLDTVRALEKHEKSVIATDRNIRSYVEDIKNMLEK